MMNDKDFGYWKNLFLGSPDEVFAGFKELLAGAWTCSPAAIQQDTGWSAAVPLASGVRRTVRWYREQNML